MSNPTYNYSFPLPAVANTAPASSYDPHQAMQVIDWLINGTDGYAQYVQQAAAATRVPAGFIIGIIVKETGGYYNGSDASIQKMTTQVTDPSTDDSTGLMQVDPETFYEVVVAELAQGRLSQPEIDMINTYVPSWKLTVNSKLSPTASSSFQKTIQQALLNPEFNIWAGAIRLSYIFDKNIERSTGIVRLDKVIHMYNAGDYRLSINDKYAISLKPLWDVLSIGQLYLHFMPEVQAYVETILGPDGVLDLMVNQNVGNLSNNSNNAFSQLMSTQSPDALLQQGLSGGG